MDTQRWVLLGFLAIVMVGILLYSLTVVKRLSRLKRKLEEEPREDPAPGSRAPPSVSLGREEALPRPRDPMSALGRLEAFSSTGVGATEGPKPAVPEPPPLRAPGSSRPVFPEAGRAAAPELRQPAAPEPARPRTQEGQGSRPVSPLDLDGPPPPAPKGSEAEEAALLLAGQQPKGLPSFSELAAVSAAEAAAIRNAEVDSDAIDALSLRSMIGFHSRKPIVKVEAAPAPSVEELLAQELAEKQTTGATPPPGPDGAATRSATGDPLARLLASSEPTAQPGRPAPVTGEGAATTASSPAATKLKPDAFAGLAVIAGRASSAGNAQVKTATAARGSQPGTLARPAWPTQPPRPAVGLDALERRFAKNPQDPELGRLLAEGYLEAGRLDDAIGVLVELVDSAAGNESDLFNLGLALSRRGNQEDAKACFLKLKTECLGSPWAGKAAVQLLKLKLGS